MEAPAPEVHAWPARWRRLPESLHSLTQQLGARLSQWAARLLGRDASPGAAPTETLAGEPEALQLHWRGMQLALQINQVETPPGLERVLETLRSAR